MICLVTGQVLAHRAGLTGVVGNEPPIHEPITKFGVYQNVTEAIMAYKDDPLLYEPGKGFAYSQYSFQVMGAIIESVLNQTFESAMNQMFKDLGMNSTFCDRREPIIPHRARYYVSDPGDPSKLYNAPIHDDLITFEKWWAAAAIASNVHDILRIGEHLIKWSKGQTSSAKCKLILQSPSSALTFTAFYFKN